MDRKETDAEGNGGRPAAAGLLSADAAGGEAVLYRPITAAGFAVIAVTFGLARYSYGLFLPDIEREFDLTKEWLGLIASGSYAGYICSTVFSLCISGIIGPRAPIATGAIFASAGMILVAVAWTPGVLALGVVLAGASPGFVFAPISDAVMRAVAAARRNRTWTIMNSGNGVGVLIAGPVALWAAADWRWAWSAFAILAALTAAWNGTVMPSGRDDRAGGHLPRLRASWFLSPESYPLFACSFLVGGVTTVYWTFATSLIDGAGGALRLGDAIGVALRGSDLRIGFWTILGAAGIIGAAGGDIITRFGLRRALQATCLSMGLAVGLLAAMPALPVAIAASAVVFGAAFILVTGELGVWSVYVFADRPSAGFGATFLMFAFGALVGPAVAGLAAAQLGLAPVFHATAALGVVMAALAPRQTIHSMAR